MYYSIKVTMGLWIIIFIFSIVSAIIFTNIIFTFVQKRFHLTFLKKHHEFTGLVINVFGVLYSVFLGFTIVNSQQNLQNIIHQVDEEAYLSESIFQSAKLFPPEVQKTIQNNVLDYMESIIKNEWPLMKKRMESPITLMNLEKMWNSVMSYTPKTNKEEIWYKAAVDYLLKQSSARLKRIYASWEAIGFLSWIALILGGIIITSLLFFFGAENIIAHRILISIFVSFFTFMLFIVYALDNPFKFPINIQPKAYQVIYNYDKETHGTMISPEKISINIEKNNSEFNNK